MIHRRRGSFSEAMHYINNAQLLVNNSNILSLTTKKIGFYPFILNKTNAKIVKPIFCVFLFVISVILGHTEASLATHVPQFIFISDCGFRFPIAQFPSGQCSPDLYLQFWKGVEKMEEIGFKYVISSSCNSSFPPVYGFNIGYCYALKNFLLISFSRLVSSISIKCLYRDI